MIGAFVCGHCERSEAISAFETACFLDEHIDCSVVPPRRVSSQCRVRPIFHRGYSRSMIRAAPVTYIYTFKREKNFKLILTFLQLH